MEQTIQTREVFNYLSFVPFSELNVWDVKRQNNESLLFSYPVTKLSSFLKKAKISWVEIDDDFEYPILGVRANGKGVYLNRIAKGSELTMRRYQKSKSYHLFYCKVRTVNGQWGIVYPEFENSYGSSNMQYLEIDREKIIPEFLELILHVKEITDQWDKNAIGADGRHFPLDTLLNLEMPLPELPEQEKILSDYNLKIKESEKLEVELNSFTENFENTLFEFLGVTKIPVKQATNSLQFINLVNTSRWGYQYLLNHEQSERLLDTAKFPQKLLSSLVLLNPTTSFSELKKDNKISFLPMECVSDLYGEVIEYRDGKVQSSGGYTKFQEGDLLWSKITPCMQNGKSCIVENLENGFGYGSTEYHVIREKEESEIHLRFLYHLLRTKYVLTNATFHFTGSAGQQRVPIEFLANLNVPLPSIDEQKEISIQLDKLIAERKVKQVKVTELKEQAIKDFEAIIFKT